MADLPIPDELLPEIFQFVECRAFLMSVPLVCRRWRRAAKETRATLKFGWLVGPLPIYAARDIGDRVPRAVALEFYQRHRVTDAVLGVFASRCRELKRLRLYQCTGVTDLGLEAVLTLCPRVSELILFGCRGLTTDCMLTIAAMCGHRLRMLDMSCLPHVIRPSGIRAIATGCRNLRWLYLQSSGDGVTDNAVAALAAGCKKLELIDLEGSYLLTDAGVRFMTRGLPELRDVDVSACTQLTPEAVIELRDHAPKLMQVSLGYIGSEVAEEAVACFGAIDAILMHGEWGQGGLWGY